MKNSFQPERLTGLVTRLAEPYGPSSDEKDYYNVRVAELMATPRDADMVRDQFMLAQLSMGKHSEIAKLRELGPEYDFLVQLLMDVTSYLQKRVSRHMRKLSTRDMEAEKEALSSRIVFAFRYAEKMRTTEMGYAVAAPVCAAAFAVRGVDINLKSFLDYAKLRGDQDADFAAARMHLILALELNPRKSFIQRVWDHLGGKSAA